MSVESKKIAILRILDILEKESDEQNPLTYEKIENLLYTRFGIEIERKAIARNISLLNEAGYPIKVTNKGSYLENRLFENAEIRLLIDSILSSRYLNEKHSKDLIEKLSSLGGHNFNTHIKHVYAINSFQKSDNYSLLLNIELIDEAIENEKQVIFTYNKCDIDNKLHSTKKQIVSPYQLIIHNQRYYLMCYNEYWKQMGFYRLDKITDIKILDTPLTIVNNIKGYEKGIDYKDLSCARPYMYTDKAIYITIKCRKNLYDDIVDWFGHENKITDLGDEILVTVLASPKALSYWALQYLDSAEIIKPESLRNEIREKIEDGLKKYQ